MASKKEEMMAFNKLRKSFPNESVDLTMDQWYFKKSGIVSNSYRATIANVAGDSSAFIFTSLSYANPMDAVDELILKSKSVS